jgi:hypothetical protein
VTRNSRATYAITVNDFPATRLTPSEWRLLPCLALAGVGDEDESEVDD